jgi:hypothetical protein
MQERPPLVVAADGDIRSQSALACLTNQVGTTRGVVRVIEG